MPTTPITLTPVGGLPYTVVKGHLVMMCTGPWVLDVELDASSVATLGVPSGKVVVVFGGVPMSGTVDPTSSGSFGPTAMVRVVAGANGWSKSPPAQTYHADNGVLSTQVYTLTATAVGEIVTDLSPTQLGVDFAVDGASPAMAVFRDQPWWVDVTGATFVGTRPPAVPDPSLVIRDYDPVHGKVSFSCDTLLIPGTPLVDPRFGATSLTAWNVEQIFDSSGSTGWAWSGATASTTVLDDLKAAVLYWTRAAQLRVYRYRLVLYQGDGPGGPPPRMALQAVTPGAGMPDMVPITPWSGMAGVVAELALSTEVLVVFENADPTLPRVIGYSLLATPLKNSIDATVEVDVGASAPLVNLAGGADFLVLATPYAGLISALTTFAAACASATSVANVASAGSVLHGALGGLPTPATTKVRAT